MKKSKLFFYSQLYFITTLFWVALYENLTLFILTSGAAISIVTIYFTERYLLKDTFYNVLDFNMFSLLIYFINLLYEIYANALITIYQIITLQNNPDIVEIHTDLENYTKKCILANSITLTPGTITIDLEDNHLKVLWLDAKSKNPVIAGNLIKGKLERYLNI